MLAAGADPQPDRRLEEDDVRDDHEREAGPRQDAEVPDRPVEEVAHTREIHVRQQRDSVRHRGVVVELDEEVAGYPDGKEVDTRPADDLVGA